MGAATVVCTDKTGTLTRNQIRVQTVLLAGLRAAPQELPGTDPRVARLAEIMALCNDATSTGGDPIEVALLRSLEPLPATCERTPCGAAGPGWTKPRSMLAGS